MPIAHSQHVHLNPLAQDWNPDNNAAAGELQAADCSGIVYPPLPPTTFASALLPHPLPPKGGPNDVSHCMQSLSGCGYCPLEHGASGVSSWPLNNAWMGVRRGFYEPNNAMNPYYQYYYYYYYYYYHYYWYAYQWMHRYRYVQRDPLQWNTEDSVPSTAAALCDAPCSPELETDTVFRLEDTNSTMQEDCNRNAKMYTCVPEALVISPHSFCVQKEGDECDVDLWHRILDLAHSSCLLCGKDNHRYTACRFFDGKILCFIHVTDSCIYAMRHDGWIRRATLRDVYSFLRLAVGIMPSQVALHVGSRVLTLADYPPEVRCCDLQLLPGAVVGILRRPDSMGERLPLPPFPRFGTTNGESLPQLDPYEEERVAANETFDAPTIGKGSRLSISLHALDRPVRLRVANAMEETTDATEESSDQDTSEKTPPYADGRSATPLQTPRDANEDIHYDSEIHDVATSADFAVVSPAPDSTSKHVVDSIYSRSAPCGTSLRGNNLSELLSTVRQEYADSTKPNHEFPPFVSQPACEDIMADEGSNRLRRTVHVRFIPVSMPFAAIRRLLWSCGEVFRVRLVKPKETVNPERMFYVCFVEFATEEGAERMLKQHGRCLSERFRLEVGRSRHVIRGGYITDHDANTGKPCTFGLDEAKRRSVELRFSTGSSSARVCNSGEMIDASTGGLCGRQGVSRRRRRRDGRHRTSASATAAIADNNKNNSNEDTVDAGATTQPGGSDALGPYSLEIVATTDLGRHASRDLCRSGCKSCTQGDTISALPPKVVSPIITATKTMAALPQALGRDSAAAAAASAHEELLRSKLRGVLSCYVEHATSASFHKALVVLEDVKWYSLRVMFRLYLLECEVALFLHYVNTRIPESAIEAATRAVLLGNELLQLLYALSAGTTRIHISWRSLFTTTPPAHQQEREWNHGGEEKDIVEAIDRGVGTGGSRQYPCCEAVLRFIEHLLHIVLLFDDFQRAHGHCSTDEGEGKATTPVMSSAKSVVWELVLCARRLLSRLQFEIASEKETAPCGVSVWRTRISHLLQHLPTHSDWTAGHLMEIFLPHVGRLSTATLSAQVEGMNPAEQDAPPLLFLAEPEGCVTSHCDPAAVANAVHRHRSDTSNTTDGVYTSDPNRRTSYSNSHNTGNEMQRHVRLDDSRNLLGRRCSMGPAGGLLLRGMVTTYDPLSKTRDGRVQYNAVVAQAMVNTSEQFKKMERLQCQSSISTPLVNASAKSGDRNHHSRQINSRRGDDSSYTNGNNYSTSQRLLGSSTVLFSTATPTTASTNSKRTPLARNGFKSSGVQSEGLTSASPVKLVVGAKNGGRSSDFFFTNSMEGDFNTGLKQDGSTLECRRGSDPVTWCREWALPKVVSDRGSPPRRTPGERRDCRTSCHRDAGDICPAPVGKTIHHKQLTEAFYGNWKGGVLAREAYLHFMSKMNRRVRNRDAFS